MTVIGDTPDWINPQAGLNVQTPLLDGVTLAASGQSAELDLAPYSSLLIYSLSVSTNGFALVVQDVDSNFALTQLTTPPDGLGLTLPPIPGRCSAVSVCRMRPRKASFRSCPDPTP